MMSTSQMEEETPAVDSRADAEYLSMMFKTFFRLDSYLVDTNILQNSFISISGFLTVLILFILGVAFIFRYILIRTIKDEHGHGLPPGPIGLPIVGSYPFINRHPEISLNRWSLKFGNLYSLWVGSQLWVIISDPIIARELLTINGAIFSSRKTMYIKSRTVFASRGITAAPYDEKWRKHRRIASNFLSPQAAKDQKHIIDHESITLLQSIYAASRGGQNSMDPQPHVGRYSLNTMTAITFGKRTDSVDHPLVKSALQLSREFMNCTGPMSNAIDFVPILQYFPNSLLNRARKLHNGLVELYGGMISDIGRQMDAKDPVPHCLVKHILLLKEEENLDDLDIIMLASAFMIGGVETTAAIMHWFLALIPSYPEIQQKAHEELDGIVGHGRLPTLADEKNLPYCRAIIKEVERYRNPFWLPTPHFSTEDFTYRGYYIPKNTVVMLNAWTMHHNPERYADPHIFNPDRYLGDDLSSAESARLIDPTQRDHWIFGAGRRICPGMTVAENEMWLGISRLLWAFDISADGIIPYDESDGLSGRSPIPFNVHFKPRHSNVMGDVQDLPRAGRLCYQLIDMKLPASNLGNIFQ